MTSDDGTTKTETEPVPVPPNKKGGANGSAKAAGNAQPTKKEEATASGAAPEPATRSREITKRRA
jgi:hypothetical protein